MCLRGLSSRRGSFSFTLLASTAELPCPGIEPTETAHQLVIRLSQDAQALSERSGVRCLHGTEAAVATAVKARAQRTTTCVGDWSKHGIPRATAIHTFPLRLQARHTLLVGMFGLRPQSVAVINSIS